MKDSDVSEREDHDYPAKELLLFMSISYIDSWMWVQGVLS